MKLVHSICLFLICATSASVASDVEILAEAIKEMKELKKTIETLQSDVTALETTEEIGTSYVRWGRTSCDGPATLVYQGYVGGSIYSAVGGGSNYVCLPDFPMFSANVAGTTGDSILYGVEFELNDANYVFLKNNSHGATLQDFSVSCAVCYTRNMTTVLTIPARVTCPVGWTKEYQGYMMSANSAVSANYRTEYICVDEAPEAADGGVSQNQGKLYMVEVTCGSLPCSVYVNGYELNCIVCSR